MRVVLALLTALTGLLLGWPTHAVADTPAALDHVTTYTYGGIHGAAARTDTTAERGPPASSFPYTGGSSAVDAQSHVISARVDTMATHGYTDYDPDGKLAQIASGRGTALTVSGAHEGDVRPTSGARVAANAGRVAGPARSTDLVMDSFRGLGKGRNAHVRTVGSVDELQDTFNAWSVGAERLAARGPKVPDVYRLPDDGVIQWRTSSATGGPSIDIFPVSGRQRTVHLADGATW